MADNEVRNEMDKQNNMSDDNTVDKAAKYATQITNNAFSSAKDIANNTSAKVGEELSSAYEKSKKILSNPSVFYGLIAVIVIAIICVVVIYYFIAESVFNKKHTVIEKTKFPIKGNVKTKLPIENFPSSGNGLKRTYTFWVYVQDLNNANGAAKHVFSIGDESTLGSNSPIVFISKTNNSLCVAFPKNGDKQYSDITNIDPSDPREDIKNLVYFDYLPLQRWVHIAVVIYDDHYGAQVSLYMDSQLVKNITNGESLATGAVDGGGLKYELKDLNIDKTGMLIVGGDNGITPGFNGLLSKVGIYNYELNSRDIYQIYSEGPIDGVLASLGYGVRNPVYKLSD